MPVLPRLPVALAPLLAAAVACSSDHGWQAAEADPMEFNPPALASPTQRDTFIQIDQPQSDVLFVIDNSASMAEEQLALTDNFPAFIQYFLGSGLDYHLGVVSTDMQDPTQSGQLIPVDGGLWIDQNTPDPIGAFTQLASLGTEGFSHEQGLDAAYSALQLRKDSENAGFLRAQSNVSVIVISDEDDQSTLLPIEDFSAWFAGLRGDPTQRTFSSVVSPRRPDFPCYGAGKIGERYLEVTEAVGGIEWSICDTDWAGLLEKLGLQAAGKKKEYFLSQLPQLDTIAVSVQYGVADLHFDPYDPATGDGDWTYDPSRNSVTFVEYVPDPFATVTIEYTPLGTAEGQ